MRETDENEALDQPRGELMLWLGFLLAPLAWVVDLELLYLLSHHGCASMNFLPNHLASALFLITAIVGGFIAWSNWRKAGAAWPDSGGSSLSRSRFLAALGILSSMLFSALIFAQWLPTIMGVPCGK